MTSLDIFAFFFRFEKIALRFEMDGSAFRFSSSLILNIKKFFTLSIQFENIIKDFNKYQELYKFTKSTSHTPHSSWRRWQRHLHKSWSHPFRHLTHPTNLVMSFQSCHITMVLSEIPHTPREIGVDKGDKRGRKNEEYPLRRSECVSKLSGNGGRKESWCDKDGTVYTKEDIKWEWTEDWFCNVTRWIRDCEDFRGPHI